MFVAEYRFSEIVTGFFEFPTENARRLLPGHLEPLEPHHGASVLSVGVFDVVESPVGPQRTVVMSVLVVPLFQGKEDEQIPNSAFHPFLSASTTSAARDLAIEHLHLPHWTDDVEIEITHEGRTVRTSVRSEGELISEMSVSEHSWAPVAHLYQSFVKDKTGAYMARIHATGRFSEHQEETGRLVLYDHPFNAGLTIADVYDVPLRETLFRNGTQSFEPLVQLQPA